jgi:16S rRNA (cytosine1402-N4)-methyltransferase
MSSEELEESGRGFSFQRDEPLLMTYDANPTIEASSAEKIVNTFPEEVLVEIFRKFGEERFSRRYARTIIASRKLSPIRSSRELAAIIESVAPPRTAASRLYGAPRRRVRIHPATRIFQALRIAVNQELDNLSALIENGFSALNPGGRMLIISYHSLEDRIVKQAFRKRAAEGAGKMLVKKPIRPTAQEVSQNPRSRSAKLRVIQKL